MLAEEVFQDELLVAFERSERVLRPPLPCINVPFDPILKNQLELGSIEQDQDLCWTPDRVEPDDEARALAANAVDDVALSAASSRC